MRHNESISNTIANHNNKGIIHKHDVSSILCQQYYKGRRTFMPHIMPSDVDNLVNKVYTRIKRWCNTRQQMICPLGTIGTVGIQRQVREKQSANKESDLTHKPREGQKGRRKQSLPGEPEVWENRPFILTERLLKKG